MSTNRGENMGDKIKLAAILLACAAIANATADDDDCDDDSFVVGDEVCEFDSSLCSSL